MPSLDDLRWPLIAIPLISGLIGYVTNWVGIKMLFYPVRFVGFRVPGLAQLGRLAPRKLQAVPGLARGRVGWQGVIPSRAAKMGSIAVDKGVAKLGSAQEFYTELDPERIAQHILDTSRDDVRELVERTIEAEYGRLWTEAPDPVREAVHARIQSQLPEIVERVTAEIGNHIDQVLDIKLMVIRHIEERPELANRIFLEVGERELTFVVNAGALYGFGLGIPSIGLTLAIDSWWPLPIAGVVVGYLTNWIALKQIFLPLRDRRFGPFRIRQGLFLRRQDEVARQYARLIASDVVNLRNIAEEFLHGRRADRARSMIAAALAPAVDRAAGPLRGAVRLSMGAERYDEMRDRVVGEAYGYTVIPLSDPEFNAEQATHLEDLLTERMRELPPEDFAELLRSATEEDEWMLLLIGSVLGFCAGLVQSVFTVL